MDTLWLHIVQWLHTVGLHVDAGVAREVVPALLTVEVRHCLRTAAPLREDDRYVLSCAPYQFHLGRVDGEWRWVEFAADGEG